MNVISLFDGIACGRIALDRIGINPDCYTAYEIDPDAIKVSSANYPDIVHMGDVFNANYECVECDLLIGGSPCEYWSVARTDGKRETQVDGIGFNLFMQYYRALTEAKPIYFLYENNFSINREIVDTISKYLGVEPVMINSSLVSGQSRKRYYWTNIPFNFPNDKNIMLYDVVDFSTHNFRPIGKWTNTIWGNKRKLDMLKTINSKKSHTLTTSKTHSMGYYLNEDKTMYCNLTVNDFEALQTLPIGYVDNIDIKESAKYRVIGKAWTVDIIAEILKGIKGEHNVI